MGYGPIRCCLGLNFVLWATTLRVIIVGHSVLSLLCRFLFDTFERLCSETIHICYAMLYRRRRIEVQMSSRQGGRWRCRFVRPYDLYCLAFGFFFSFLFAFFLSHSCSSQLTAQVIIIIIARINVTFFHLFSLLLAYRTPELGLLLQNRYQRVLILRVQFSLAIKKRMKEKENNKAQFIHPTNPLNMIQHADMLPEQKKPSGGRAPHARKCCPESLLNIKCSKMCHWSQFKETKFLN